VSYNLLKKRAPEFPEPQIEAGVLSLARVWNFLFQRITVRPATRDRRHGWREELPVPFGDFLVLAFSQQPGALLSHDAVDAFVD
jgi:lysophospholipid acyltransferase (LPLAT)-like uncharacterized protein